MYLDVRELDAHREHQAGQDQDQRRAELHDEPRPDKHAHEDLQAADAGEEEAHVLRSNLLKDELQRLLKDSQQGSWCTLARHINITWRLSAATPVMIEKQ